MPVAQRFTTEYIDHEDRLRISASLANDEVAVMWLTRRLLDRLATHLSGLLEQETEQAPLPEVRQTFVQQAAVASHLQQSQEQEQVPVQPQQAQVVHEWLVHEVDVTPMEHGVRLRLRGAHPHEQVELGMPPLLLRQWLGIVHGQYQRANWPLSPWPVWMNEAAQSVAAAEKSGVVLH